MTGTVADLLDLRAGDGRIGLRAGDSSWTWAEVVSESRARARLLLDARPPGPFHVGILLGNVPEYLFLLGGVALAGAVAVGINSTRRGEELARDVRHTDCGLIVTDSTHVDLLDGLDLGDATVLLVDTPDWARLVGAEHDSALSSVAIAPDDLFLLIFTSGSTGAPKAVRMTHGRAYRAAMGAGWASATDVFYCAMPLFHGNALNAAVLPALATGAALALRERFSASALMSDVRRYGCTSFSTVGRALSYVLATPPAPNDREHHLKFVLAPESSPADVTAFQQRFGVPVVTGYGSSENAIVMVPVPGMPKDALGRPAEGLDAAVVDPETGVECRTARFDATGRLTNASEAIGEIVGRNVVDRFEGYYANPEADAQRTRDGWYWSGDLGYRNDEGFFWFAGRVGDWVRVDGENFATAPVERILARYPGILGVVVFPVPDERTADDQIMAALELAPDTIFEPDGFARFLAAQPDLGTKWSPRYLRLVTELPVTATNKLDKRPLRDERWNTSDPLYWRPERDGPYRRMLRADVDALHEQFHVSGRADVLDVR